MNVKKILNQILYGPPGTGKTYSTVIKALDILEATDKQKESIKSIGHLKKVFGSQVEFITFHQSFSYEDFVEGLKANTDDNGNIAYKIESGVFKTICDNAKDSGNDSLNKLNKAIDEFKKQVSDNNSLELKTLSQEKQFECYYEQSDIFSIDPQSSTNTGYKVYFNDIIKLYKSSTDKVHNISYVKAILNYLIKEYSLQKYKQAENKEAHILIIDEINRGNISRIFGELITLIEESKRGGNHEEISLQLPYSKKPFTVPSNLYIIGTMNTADRSLTLMDTALRRRFDFIEMLPDITLVQGSFDGIDVQKILKSINERIEILYDREHTIGHAFLMNIDNLDALRNAFKNKILPLLEEYFYDDSEKIQLVLNDNSNSFYKKEEKELGDFSKAIYIKQNINNVQSKAFIEIYQASKDNEK